MSVAVSLGLIDRRLYEYFCARQIEAPFLRQTAEDVGRITVQEGKVGEVKCHLIAAAVANLFGYPNEKQGILAEHFTANAERRMTTYIVACLLDLGRHVVMIIRTIRTRVSLDAMSRQAQSGE